MCKKIRDDKGYWEQVEVQVGKRTGADFSHGYCPECFEKAMKELDRDHGVTFLPGKNSFAPS